jgi:hypothetical protein
MSTFRPSYAQCDVCLGAEATQTMAFAQSMSNIDVCPDCTRTLLTIPPDRRYDAIMDLNGRPSWAR